MKTPPFLYPLLALFLICLLPPAPLYGQDAEVSNQIVNEADSTLPPPALLPLPPPYPDRGSWLLANTYVSRGADALRSGRLEEADALYEAITELNPNDPRGYLGLADVARSKRDWDLAEKHLRRALRVDPQLPQAWAQLGELAFERSDAGGAFQAFEEAAEADRYYLPAVKFLGYLRGEDASATYPEQYFRIPSSPAVTRAELAALLHIRVDLMASLQTPPSPKIITDISGHWAQEAILEVAKYDLMEVLPDHTFEPDVPIQRAELAQILSNVLKGLQLLDRFRSLLPAEEPDYSDVGTLNLQYSAIALATSSHMMPTRAGRAFAPSDPVSGSEAMTALRQLDRAVRLMRAIETHEGEEGPPSR